MDITPRIDLTPEARFFLAPDHPLQRQYEAFRAYFVEGLPSLEVARRFGYAPGPSASSVISSANWLTSRGASSRPSRPGRASPPPAMQSANWSSPCASATSPSTTSKRELAQGGHTISINALAVLLREEGFTRLPRRLDEERPPPYDPRPRPWPTSALSASSRVRFAHGWEASSSLSPS